MTIRGATRAALTRFEALSGHPAGAWEGVEKLVGHGVAESGTLDYKRLAYNDPQRDKQEQNDELRKDVASFANASGGIILLGVTDSSGRPGVIKPLSGLDATEGELRGVIRSRIEPPIDGVEILPVEKPGSADGCLLIVIPASIKAPHAFRPHGDPDALKYPLRVGRHTQWLTESQVRDRHLAQFGAAQRQDERVQAVLDDLRGALHRRGWLLLALVPEQPVEGSVTRDRVSRAQAWWDGRRSLKLLPPHTLGPALASAGSHRVRFAHSDGRTSVPSEVYAELHDDGSCGLAVELAEAPNTNPSFFLDHLVGAVLDGLTVAGDLCKAAGVAGEAVLRAELFFPERVGQEIQAWDPSWSTTPVKLTVQTKTAQTTHSVNLDQFAEASDLLGLVGEVAGNLAHHFGAPDAQYVAPGGAVRVKQYQPRDGARQIAPRARELGVEIEEGM